MENLILNATDFEVVRTEEDGNPLYAENGYLYIQRKSDGCCFTIKVTDSVKQMFCLQSINTSVILSNNFDQKDKENVNSSSECMSSASSTNYNHTSKDKWTRNAILHLISCYGKFKKQLTSTTVKREAAWKLVADEMHRNNFQYSSSQCREKWKYLKLRYSKKKDNMKDKSSGAERYNFEFFEEMDKEFSNSPNITPIAIASSRRKYEEPEKIENKKIECDILDCDNNDSSDLPPKMCKLEKQKQSKKNSIEIFANEFMQQSAKREEARERRHIQNLELKNTSMQIFKETMNELLNKF